MQDCFALLDDCDATLEHPGSRLYSAHVETLPCHDADDLRLALVRMETALAQGRYAIGLFTYELGAGWHGIAARDGVQMPSQILLFERCERLSAKEVEAWLAQREVDASQGRYAGIANRQQNLQQEDFAAALARIHAYIEAGDTYQTNFTYRLRFDAYGSIFALYRRLRARQPAPYGALIALPDGEAVLSLSPELFVRHQQGRLTARPMKGTAPAADEQQTSQLRADALAADVKNRAENLMIVDLLRNDLSRIAKLGSVQVPHLFEVDRYGQVLQMTSTVTADLRDDAGLYDVFAALFPCGSITGAPKRRTMQIIRELESAPRGVYTGAIGWFDAAVPGRAVGDFCLSVPIRTLVLQAPGAEGVRAGEMGVGAGIVHQSEAADEYEECRLKADFLMRLPHDFALLETMQATREQGCRHLERHLQRMRGSALYFGIPYDESHVRAILCAACDNLPPQTISRMRLSLAGDGTCDVQSAPLAPLPDVVTLCMAGEPVMANDLFLRHKTTVRERYDAAWHIAEQRGAFDMLFFNQRGELTEGARSNLLLQIDGQWWTPPLTAGVLPGVMRSVLFDDPAWRLREAALTIDDLQRAGKIAVCNALRGVLSARLEDGWSGQKIN